MEYTKYTVQAAGAFVAALLGGLPLLVKVLLAVMVLDIAAGLLAAYVTQRLSSQVSFRGMAKKALVLLLVGAAAALTPVVGAPLADAVAGFYVVHEIVSIIENAAVAGLPVPQVLRDALVRVPGGEKAGKGQNASG